VFVFTHTMPGDGGVCGVVLLEVLLGEPEVDEVDFAIVEPDAAGGIVFAVVLVGAAGVEVDAAAVEVFVELAVVVDVLDPVVVAVPEVPPVDLLDLDLDGFLFEVELLFEVDVLDEVDVLEDPLGACDLRSPEETPAIKNASNTGGTARFPMGKIILSVS